MMDLPVFLDGIKSKYLPATIKKEAESILWEEECIVVIYALWSGIGIANTKICLARLAEMGYPYPVYLIDHDSMSIEAQGSLFGEGGHGWGEMFIFRKGIVTQKFTGKKAARDFMDFTK